MSELSPRLLGDLPVSPLGLGCWAIGGAFYEGDTPLGWGEVDDQESVAAIHAAIEAGISFIDTSDLYGAGHSELVIGKALKGYRDKVVLATKFGFLFDETSRQVQGAFDSADYVVQACEASLKRLGTEYLDLYQIHVPQLPSELMADVFDALEGLIQQGKILCYGWSTDDFVSAKALIARANCGALQFQMNVFDPSPDLLHLSTDNDVLSIIRSPLAMGALTERHPVNGPSVEAASDIRNANLEWVRYFKNGRVEPDYEKRFLAVREILSSDGRSAAQGALAWIWAQSPFTIPIPGFRTVDQVLNNAAALEFGALTESQVVEIESLLRGSSS